MHDHRSIPALAAAALGLLLATGCGGSEKPAKTPEASPDTLTPAPRADEMTYIRGRRAYQDQCARCHGGDGRGTGPDTAQLRNADGTPATPLDFSTVSPNTDFDMRLLAIARSIKDGVPRTPMPGHPELTNAQIWDLARHINSLIETGYPEKKQ